LVNKKFSAADVAVSDEQLKPILNQILKTSYFKPYFTNDLIGVQLGGTIKNLLTLLIGMAQGYGCAQNSIAYLVTLGLQQASEISKVLGGQEKTIYGLSGLGDLFLCSAGILGRNLQVGRLIGAGKKLEELHEFKVLPEGINSAQPFHELLQKHNLDFPLFKGIYEVIFKDRKFEDLLNELTK